MTLRGKIAAQVLVRNSPLTDSSACQSRKPSALSGELTILHWKPGSRASEPLVFTRRRRSCRQFLAPRGAEHLFTSFRCRLVRLPRVFDPRRLETEHAALCCQIAGLNGPIIN